MPISAGHPWSPAERRRRLKSYGKSVDPTVFEQKVWDALKAAGRSTSADLESTIGSHRNAIGAACHRLMWKGYVSREALPKMVFWTAIEPED